MNLEQHFTMLLSWLSTIGKLNWIENIVCQFQLGRDHLMDPHNTSLNPDFLVKEINALRSGVIWYSCGFFKTGCIFSCNMSFELYEVWIVPQILLCFGNLPQIFLVVEFYCCLKGALSCNNEILWQILERLIRVFHQKRLLFQSVLSVTDIISPILGVKTWR